LAAKKNKPSLSGGNRAEGRRGREKFGDASRRRALSPRKAKTGGNLAGRVERHGNSAQENVIIQGDAMPGEPEGHSWTYGG